MGMQKLEYQCRECGVTAQCMDGYVRVFHYSDCRAYKAIVSGYPGLIKMIRSSRFQVAQKVIQRAQKSYENPTRKLRKVTVA
jgi:hypothetical protein